MIEAYGFDGAMTLTEPDGAGTLYPSAAASDSNDVRLRLAVMEALHWDLSIPPRHVTVEVDEGWVALRGKLKRAHARHRAEWSARGVPGVRGVVNAITLED